MKNDKGFMQIIIIIALIIVIISLLGISLREVYSKLSANPAVGENFKFVKDWIVGGYNAYLSEPLGKLFNFGTNYLFQIFPEAKK